MGVAWYIHAPFLKIKTLDVNNNTLHYYVQMSNNAVMNVNMIYMEGGIYTIVGN